MWRDQYFITDSHCHIYPERIAAKAAEGVGSFYGETAAHGGTLSELLAVGEAAGIDRYLVHSVATTPHQVASINAFIAKEVGEHGGRLIGFGALHPDAEDMAGDIDALCRAGLRGVKLHPDIQKFRLDDPKCDRMYALCSERELPILIHTGDNRYDYSNPDRLLPVLRAYPKLTVIGAHLGGWSVWEEASRSLADIPNLYVDTSSALCYLPAEVSKRIILRYGTERVLFGADYPLHSPARELELMEAMELGDGDYRRIFNENITRLLGL